VYFATASAGTATWNQYGNVMVTANTYGLCTQLGHTLYGQFWLFCLNSAVYFQDCGMWNQYGTPNIPNSGTYAVINKPHYTWLTAALLHKAIHKNMTSCDIYNVTPSASPTHLPIVLPIVQNVMAKFSSSMPQFNISTPLAGMHIRFGIAFDKAVAMGASKTTISSESSYMVTNTSHAMMATFMYQSNLVNNGGGGGGANATRQGILEQVFSFSNTSQQASLCQNLTTFPIPPGGIKWSLWINASESNSATSFTGGLNVTFSLSLSDLSFPSATAPATITNATVLSTTHTSSNITTLTTYYLPLLNPQDGRLVGVLEVFDWALVDDVLVAINHSILSPSTWVLSVQCSSWFCASQHSTAHWRMTHHSILALLWLSMQVLVDPPHCSLWVSQWGF